MSTVTAQKVNIKNNLWTINDAITLNENNTQKIEKNLLINTNFNYEKISNLYSDLSSITLWGLIKLKEDYQTVNYSTIEIDYQFQKNSFLSYLSNDYVFALYSYDDESQKWLK